MKKLILFALCLIFLISPASAVVVINDTLMSNSDGRWFGNSITTLGCSQFNNSGVTLAGAECLVGGSNTRTISRNLTGLISIDQIQEVRWAYSHYGGSSYGHGIRFANSTARMNSDGVNFNLINLTTTNLTALTFADNVFTYNILKINKTSNILQLWSLIGGSDYSQINTAQTPNLTISNFNWTQLRPDVFELEFDKRFNNSTFRELLLMGSGVSLNSPSDTTRLIANSILFNSSAIRNQTFTNSTVFLWYSNGTLFNKTTNATTGGINTSLINITNLPVSPFIWNVQFCDNTNACEFALNNFTFHNGYTVNSESWINLTAELASQEFELNISVPSGLSSTQATLVYNNTRFSGNLITEGSNRIFSKTISAPEVTTERNITFYWEINLIDGTSVFFNNTAHIQTVRPISLDNCTTNTQLIYNYTQKDEDTRDTLGATQNTSIQLSLVLSAIGNISSNITFSHIYNATNPARVCITSEILNTTIFRVDSIAEYVSSNRVTEFYNIQNESLNNNTIPRNIDLYDLLITSSQEFTINFLDNNFLAVPNALIEISRRYTGIGNSLIVEVPKTDEAGTTIGHFVLSDAVYDIIVRKEGQVLAQFTDQRVYCQDISIGRCQLNLNQASSTAGIISFRTYGNMSYYTILNQTTRQFSFTYFTTDGTIRNISMNMSAFNGISLNQSVCYQTLTASSGTITCTPSSAIDNQTIYIEVRANGLFILGQRVSPFNPDVSLAGGTRFLLAGGIILSFVLMGISSPIIAIIMFVISIILVSILGLIEIGGFVGAVSVFVVLVFGLAFIIFKMAKEEQQNKQV